MDARPSHHAHSQCTLHSAQSTVAPRGDAMLENVLRAVTAEGGGLTETGFKRAVGGAVDGLIEGSCNDLRDRFTMGGALAAVVGLVGVLGFDYMTGRAAKAVEDTKAAAAAKVAAAKAAPGNAARAVEEAAKQVATPLRA